MKLKKLKQGDYVTDLTEEQYRELFEIEKTQESEPDFDAKVSLSAGYVVYHKDNVLVWIDGLKRKNLPFDEFRARAINTFK